MLRGHEKCRVRPPWVDVEGVEPGPRLRDFGVDGNRWYVVHGGRVVGEWVVNQESVLESNDWGGWLCCGIHIFNKFI